jgi:hypothetical protein
MAVVEMDKRPSRHDRAKLLPWDAERVIERGTIRKQYCVIMGSKRRQRYGGGVSGRCGRGRRGRKGSRRRGRWTAYLYVAEESKARIPGCLLELVLAIL